MSGWGGLSKSLSSYDISHHRLVCRTERRCLSLLSSSSLLMNTCRERIKLRRRRRSRSSASRHVINSSLFEIGVVNFTLCILVAFLLPFASIGLQIVVELSLDNLAWQAPLHFPTSHAISLLSRNMGQGETVAVAE